MKKYDFVQINNEAYGEEAHLYLYDNNTLTLVLEGDAYHDKIADRISGFLEGIKYTGNTYTLKDIDIEEDDSLNMLSSVEKLNIYKYSLSVEGGIDLSSYSIGEEVYNEIKAGRLKG
jgi:hypothetical protein